MLVKWEILVSFKFFCLFLFEIDVFNMDLNLICDFIFFDIEVIGLYVICDCIIQLVMIKYFVKGKEFEECMYLINFGIFIFEEVMNVYGIILKDVVCKLFFNQVV